MAQRHDRALEFAALTLLPLALSIPVLLFIVNRVLTRAFAPMAAMTADVDRLDGSVLSALDERPVPLEALPLVQAINRMMRRLSVVLEQQRRLVSDAAHELRTPVAALIVQADNVQHVSLSPEATTRMAALRQGLTRISALIDQLLHFARVQGATPAMSQRSFNQLVRSAIEDVLLGAGEELRLVFRASTGYDLGALHVRRPRAHAVDNTCATRRAAGRHSGAPGKATSASSSRTGRASPRNI